MTRPDISYAVQQLARKLTEPKKNDWIRVKQLMRCIRGMTTQGIYYSAEQTEESLTGYSDSDLQGKLSTISTMLDNDPKDTQQSPNPLC